MIWLLVRGNDNSSSTSKSSHATPTKPAAKPRETIKAASVHTLRALAKAAGHPIYWAGPQAKVKYELLPHAHTESALAEAEALGVAADDVAKTLVVKLPKGYLRAVVPASARLGAR